MFASLALYRLFFDSNATPIVVFFLLILLYILHLLINIALCLLV